MKLSKPRTEWQIYNNNLLGCNKVLERLKEQLLLATFTYINLWNRQHDSGRGGGSLKTQKTPLNVFGIVCDTTQKDPRE